MKEIQVKSTFGSSYRKSTVRCKDLTLKIFKTNHETKVSNNGESIGIKACFFQNTDGSQNFPLYAHMSNTLDQLPVDKPWSPTESSRKMKPEVQ